MSIPDTVPTWPRIEAVAREDGTGEVIVDGNAQHVAAENLDQVRVEIIRTVTNVAISLGRPVRVSTSGPDGYWPLIVYPNGAVTADEDQPRPGRRAAVDDAPSEGTADHSQASAPASPATPVAGPEPALAPPDQPAGQAAVPPAPGPMAAGAAGEFGPDDHSEDGPRTGDDQPGADHSPDSAAGAPVDAPADAPGDIPAAPTEQFVPEAGTQPQPEAGAQPEPVRDQTGGAEPYPQQSHPGYVPPVPPPSAPPAEPVPPAEPAPQAEPGSQHEPAHGAADASPWPEQARPGQQQVPGGYDQNMQRGFGQPAGQPGPARFGQPPVGQPAAGQPPRPPMGQPPVNQPTGQPQAARASGQQPVGRSAAPHAPQRSAESAEQLPPQQRQSFLTREQIEEPASRGFRGFLGRVGIKMAPNEDERSERADVAAVSQHWPGPRTIAVVNGKGGAGKSLEINEPVLTPSGYRPIGSLEVGDLVMGRDGLPHPVVGVFPQGRRELFRVTLTDGTSILADADHLWEVQTEADRLGTCEASGCGQSVLARGLCSGHHKHLWRGNEFRPLRIGKYAKVNRTPGGNRVLTTAQLSEAGLGVDRSGRGTRHRFFIPVTQPVQFAPTKTTIDPYLLGLLLGDGGLSESSIRLSTADAELVTAVTAAVPPGVRVRHKDRYDYTLTREAPSSANPLGTMLIDLGVARKTSNGKFVPDAYRFGDVTTRTAVLQGLLDTDGWVERGTAAGFTTVSDRLADDVAFIAESLGCVVTRGVGISSYTHAGQTKSGQLAHRLRIKAPAGLELFRLERKRTQMRAGQRIPYRAIASIEPAGSGEAVCIAVASDDHLFLTRNCVPTHNTPTTVLLSAVFALFGGAGVVAWDNNQTRGTLGWRTEQGQHESTLLDLLPQIPRLLGTGAQSADLAHFVHHQTRDRFDVLRSKPMVLAHMQRLQPADVDAIHAVLGKYYRLIFIDSGNDESDPMWLRMVDHSDQLVVTTTTRDDHAEAGALLLEALAERDERSAALARSSVAIVSQADPSARPADLVRVAAGYQALTRATVTIPFDPAMVDGLLHYGALKPETKRAWLAAAAAVARGL